jgi:hypothetical protein
VIEQDLDSGRGKKMALMILIKLHSSISPEILTYEDVLCSHKPDYNCRHSLANCRIS